MLGKLSYIMIHLNFRVEIKRERASYIKVNLLYPGLFKSLLVVVEALPAVVGRPE